MRVRIVRLCFCGRPTKRPNALYCSGAHADVAYRRRRELGELVRRVDIEIAHLRQTTARILELVTGDQDRAFPGILPAFGERNQFSNPPRPIRSRNADVDDKMRRDVESRIHRRQS